jgi:hypothetical protein
MHISGKRYIEKHNIEPIDLLQLITQGLIPPPLDQAGDPIPPPDVRKCAAFRHRRADWAGWGADVPIAASPGYDLDIERYLAAVKKERGSLNSWKGFKFESLPPALSFTKAERIEEITRLASDAMFFVCEEPDKKAKIVCSVDHEQEIGKIRILLLDEKIELQKSCLQAQEVLISRYFNRSKQQEQLKILRRALEDGLIQIPQAKIRNFGYLQQKLVRILNESLKTSFPKNFKVFKRLPKSGENCFYIPKFKGSQILDRFPVDKTEMVKQLTTMVKNPEENEAMISSLLNFGKQAGWLTDTEIKNVYIAMEVAAETAPAEEYPPEVKAGGYQFK